MPAVTADTLTLPRLAPSTPAEAERTYRTMLATYRDYGYRPVELPRAELGERARFVLDALA